MCLPFGSILPLRLCFFREIGYPILRRCTRCRHSDAGGTLRSAHFQAVFLTQGWFRQSSVASSHLVVEPVETHQRVPRREHAEQAAHRWAPHDDYQSSMSKTIKPNLLSFSSLFIEAFFGENRLGIATGFPWEHDGSQYLITNWHVMTGLHPETGQPLDQSGATPDLLKVWFHLADNLGQWDCCDIPLFDNQNRPLWIEHESLR